MNWEAIGAIAEIVGALGVIVSLIYLALQIRTQNEEARIAAMHDISAGYRDALATVVEGEMADVMHKAINDYDALTGAEMLRVIAFTSRIFRVWEEAYMQFDAGRLDARMWDSMVRQFGGYMFLTPFKRIWEIRKEYFDESFRIFVEKLALKEYKMK